MTPLATALTFFPALIVLLALMSFGWLIAVPGALPALALFAVLYVLPLASFRLHNRLYPLREGDSPLVGGGYVPWYGAHQLQLFYIAFPQFEVLLRLIPGAYSAWLRLWGSRVGKAVYWTPFVDIVDRSLVEIGDRAIFGHRSGVSGHLITPRGDNLELSLHRVSIGRGAFIGAGSYVGPGAVVGDGALVKAGTHVRPGCKVAAQAT